MKDVMQRTPVVITMIIAGAAMFVSMIWGLVDLSIHGQATAALPLITIFGTINIGLWLQMSGKLHKIEQNTNGTMSKLTDAIINANQQRSDPGGQ